MADLMSSTEQTEREVRRRLDALQAATRLPRARCIGLLDAEFADKFREQRAALDKLFGELTEKARSMMAEIESAEEFVYHLDTLSSATQEKLVDARDTAIREAAKRELLAEIRRSACNRFGTDLPQACGIAFLDIEKAYTPATETQPAQDGERR